MNRPVKLNIEEIELRMVEIPLWNKVDNSIERIFALSNFVSAIGFINSIAILAERLDHHPDIMLFGWNKLKITLSTHDQGGITKLDFDLAKSIDGIKF